MSFLDRVLPMKAATYGVADNFWYVPVSGASGTVTPSTAMRLSAIQACVRLISGTTAKVPLPFYRRLADEGREKARDYPLFDLLNYMPNKWQTAFEFRRMLTAHVALNGNGYARIIPGPRGPADQLIPMHPDVVRPEQVDTSAIVYHVKQRSGETITLGQSDVFHLRDLSNDGVIGLSRIEQARDGLSMSVNAQQHGAEFFRNGARLSGVLTSDKPMTKEQRDANLKAWDETYSGPHNSGKTALLADGAKYQSLGIANEQAQLAELMNLGVEDIARLYGLPPHLIGLTEKQTSWGTGVEQMSLGFLAFHMLDWFVMWETAIQRDLVLYPRTYFAEHLVDGLLRTDFKTRMDGYAVAIDRGIINPNEARRKENMNPREDGFGDRYLRPSNMVYADEPSQPVNVPKNGQSGAVHAAGAAA